MPEATPLSATILKIPISAVLATWVPPHSSIDTPGTSTTRTRSPYFSPNIATAPAAFARSISISRTSSSWAASIQPLIKASIRSSSSPPTGRGQWKSKRRRSKSTSEPAWAIEGSTTCLRAACNRWVAVWWAWARRRQERSTRAVTTSPSRN